MTDRLSPRMEQVCELVAGRGLSYPEVAAELGISESTVKTYVEAIAVRLKTQPRKGMFKYYREVMLARAEEVAS